MGSRRDVFVVSNRSGFDFIPTGRKPTGKPFKVTGNGARCPDIPRGFTEAASIGHQHWGASSPAPHLW